MTAIPVETDAPTGLHLRQPLLWMMVADQLLAMCPLCWGKQLSKEKLDAWHASGHGTAGIPVGQE